MASELLSRLQIGVTKNGTLPGILAHCGRAFAMRCPLGERWANTSAARSINLSLANLVIARLEAHGWIYPRHATLQTEAFLLSFARVNIVHMSNFVFRITRMVVCSFCMADMACVRKTPALGMIMEDCGLARACRITLNARGG